MEVLSLDIASLTGWALNPTIYGTWDLRTLKDESMGMKLIRFRTKLKEITESTEIKVMIYERPAGRHANSIIHQAKLIAVMEEFCESNSIDYKAYSAKEIKKFATGNGNASKGDMIKFAKSKYGYEGNDDNEADAIHQRELFRSQMGF